MPPDHLVDEADPVRFLGRDLRARQQHLEGAPRPTSRGSR
jgi:hypothetical protein